jgi:hypothetical protein
MIVAGIIILKILQCAPLIWANFAYGGSIFSSSANFATVSASTKNGAHFKSDSKNIIPQVNLNL